MRRAVDEVYGLPWEYYVFVKCQLCGYIFRWGARALSVVQCPICGAYSFSPKLVSKEEYRRQMERLTVDDIKRMQREKWSPRKYP